MPNARFTACFVQVMLWYSNPYHFFTGYVEASISTGGISEPDKFHGGEHPMWLVTSHSPLLNNRKSLVGVGWIDDFFDFWLPFFVKEVRTMVRGPAAAEELFQGVVSDDIRSAPAKMEAEVPDETDTTWKQEGRAQRTKKVERALTNETQRLQARYGKEGSGAAKKFNHALTKTLRGSMNDPALLKQKMRDLFLDFDSDQSGAISFDAFSAGMQKLAVDLTPEQMRALFRVLDLDGSGQVSALEIDSLAINVIGTSAVETLLENLGKATVVDPLKLRESLTQLVESLDADKDGHMSLDELKRGFKARPELKLSDEQIEALFAVTDDDKSNTISKDELLAKLQRTRNDLFGERERFADEQPMEINVV